ncbi:MAG: CPBP family intramembrane metalloprotease [Rhodobacteraceae bacterium]|nr:CPBP family intramembrane metalloprotease [Paracoccaceae bacterium]
MPDRALFPVLFAMTAVGLWLLARTEGFRWHDLRRGAVPTWLVAGFALGVAALSAGVVEAVAPAAFLGLVQHNPAFFGVIVVLYPILSALPQELLFRVLYFRRYGAMLPGGWPGLALNGAIFALAHLMFHSWVVAAMTFAGGIVFAWAYERRGSFPLAVALHAVAGWAIFGMGLGVLFYLGHPTPQF